MEKEFTEGYCGGGKGKTTLAIGQCLRASAQCKSVIIIQFLKGRERRELDFLEELDMISIVGNLLDNALEAAEKLGGNVQRIYRARRNSKAAGKKVGRTWYFKYMDILTALSKEE